MNGKGDKYRVNWSKDYEKNFNMIFKKEEQCQGSEEEAKKDLQPVMRSCKKSLMK